MQRHTLILVSSIFLLCSLAHSEILDNNLKLHLNFNHSFTNGLVVDVSSNSADGWRMETTNWITLGTNQFKSSPAAQFYYNGFMSNDPPHVIAKGQYIAVTNVSSFQYLTNATISLWAKIDTNTDLSMLLLDNAYDPAFIGNKTFVTNSWSLGRNSQAFLSFNVYCNTGLCATRFPTDVIQSGGSGANLATLTSHLYSVTIDCINHKVITYHDGIPHRTNLMNAPFIQVYGNGTRRWLSVGAISHNGTPEWGDDNYPNASYFVGAMDDVRIYNRTLSPLEIQNLYTNTSNIFYVSPDGSDTNTGTIDDPWATGAKAALTITNGQTAIWKPGIYAPSNYITLNKSGTSNAPIVFKALPGVTNYHGFYVNRTNLVIDGFKFYRGTGVGQVAWRTSFHAIDLDRGAKYVTITNCLFTDGAHVIVMFNPPGGAPAEAAAQNCTIINNIFDGLTNIPIITLMGANHVIQGNVLRNAPMCDGIRALGSNNIIRGNWFENIYPIPNAGYDNHPDILQTFGDNGFWLVDCIFENNVITNCPVQGLDSSFKSGTVTGTLPTNSALWGITFRNNLFMYSIAQFSAGIPNLKFYNNTFYKSSISAAPLGFTFYAPDWEVFATYRGNAYGGAAVNNAFIETGGAYVNAIVDYNLVPLTASYMGGGGRTGSGKAFFRSASVAGNLTMFTQGSFSNLSGTITGAIISMYQVPSAPFDMYFIPATNFIYATNWDGGSYNVFNTTMIEGQGGWTLNQQSGFLNSARVAFRILTTTYTNGEIGGLGAKWTPSPPSDVYTNSSHNFLSGAGGVSYPNWWAEPGGINGGNPGIISTTNPRLTTNSILIGAGTNIPSNLYDFTGAVRPNPPSIGAFELSGDTNMYPVTIVSQPQSLSVSPGASASFTVGVTGTEPITYQWKKSGINIVGANTFTYSIPSVTTNNAGSYTVAVSNSLGGVISSVATLTVNTGVAPFITEQPESITSPAGSIVLFSVTAGGSATLKYQWRFNNVNIATKTNSIYGITNIQQVNAGNYTVVVTNGFGSVTSAIANLAISQSIPSRTALRGKSKISGNGILR